MLLVTLGALQVAGTAIVAASDIAVEAANRSEPVQCAEKDNVTVAFTSARVRSFRIEATHPVYLPTITNDSFPPDWTGCDMTGDPSHAPDAPPRRLTIYEDLDTWLVAWTFPSFWRPAAALVRVGDRIERNVHMLQLWVRRPNGGEEILVIYPPDGYWRARPMSPAGLAPTAFGSSFLIGPIEDAGRPVVRIKEIAFDPANKTFKLSFEQGGTASIVSHADNARHRLDVTFDTPLAAGSFAMLRSMYITDTNNDVAQIATRDESANRREHNVMQFGKAAVTELWAGRVSPSRHNNSAPDMLFTGFSASGR